MITCASCNAKPKKGTVFTHHSPDAAIVSCYLEYEVNTDNVLCYKSQLTLLSQLEHAPEHNNECLMEDIRMWEFIKQDTTT